MQNIKPKDKFKIISILKNTHPIHDAVFLIHIIILVIFSAVLSVLAQNNPDEALKLYALNAIVLCLAGGFSYYFICNLIIYLETKHDFQKRRITLFIPTLISVGVEGTFLVILVIYPVLDSPAMLIVLWIAKNFPILILGQVLSILVTLFFKNYARSFHGNYRLENSRQYKKDIDKEFKYKWIINMVVIISGITITVLFVTFSHTVETLVFLLLLLIGFVVDDLIFAYRKRKAHN